MFVKPSWNEMLSWSAVAVVSVLGAVQGVRTAESALLFLALAVAGNPGAVLAFASCATLAGDWMPALSVFATKDYAYHVAPAAVVLAVACVPAWAGRVREWRQAESGDTWRQAVMVAAALTACVVGAGYVVLSRYYSLDGSVVREVLRNAAMVAGAYIVFPQHAASKKSGVVFGALPALSCAVIGAAAMWRH